MLDQELLVEELGRLRSLLGRLQESLPRTEDGVMVVPGMQVWYVGKGCHHDEVTYSFVAKVSKDMWYEADGGIPYHISNGESPYFADPAKAHEERAKMFSKRAEEARKEVDRLKTVQQSEAQEESK